MRVRRGGIVSVDLGGPSVVDTRVGEIYKIRPAVVIQNDVGNNHSVTTIIAPISAGHTNYPFHVNLPGSMDELGKDSHVQLDQIRTVDIEERIVDKYGTISPPQIEKSKTLFESHWDCRFSYRGQWSIDYLVCLRALERESKPAMIPDTTRNEFFVVRVTSYLVNVRSPEMPKNPG